MPKMLRKHATSQIKAFTLLESLLTLAVTSFLVITLSGSVTGIFQNVEEKLFFLSFEHLYRDTQKLAITRQEVLTLTVTSTKISNGSSQLDLPETVDFSGEQRIVFDKAGGNSSLAKLQFQTDDEEVSYQLYLGSGNYKKTSKSLCSP